MLQMVSFESHGKWNPDWKISKHSQNTVGHWTLDSKARTVSNFVNSCKLNLSLMHWGRLGICT